MGDRIRSFDWARSSLGPIDRWPQSLKTSISLILNSTHPMWIGWGPDVTFFYNDAYIDVLSLAKHPQALGKPSSEVWAEIWDICGPLVDKVFRKGEASFQNDVRFFMNRGDFIEEMFYSFSYSPIRDESGNIGGLFCPTADVTPKVLNTRRLHILSELAAKSLLEKSTAGACASAMAILAKNPDDVPFALLYLIEPDGNAATLDQSCGILNGHLVNSPPKVDLTNRDTQGGLWPLWKVMQTGQLEVVSIKGHAGFSSGLAGQRLSEAVVLPVVSGGHEKPLAVLVAGISPARKLDADYRTFYELLAGHVATAIQNARAAEAEKRRADMLTELDRAKTTFFSNVSHEFRTPLTLMLGPLEDLIARRKQSPNTEDVAELEVVHRNSLRLLKLVNTLLDFSRIEAGRARAVYVETDLAELTTDLASVFRSAMEKAGLEFRVQCTPLLQPVYVDQDMWEKIVFNLLSNAFKFTLSGEVEVSMRSQNGRAVLRVRDTGLGIPAHELPNIFKRFHRIENARGRSHEGTGIGLALASELVKLHGGSIEVESEPGRGTVFQVNIPFGDNHLALGSIGTAPAGARAGSQGRAFIEEVSSWLPHDPLTVPDRINSPVSESGTTPELHDARPRILLAEDNADMRDYVYRLLNQRYQVEAVSDGVAALEAARKNPPKLVLSDVMMPGLDGFGLVRGLRSDPATLDIPIILLSARAGEDAVVEGVGAGADDYLTKPFSARELMTRVAAHLEMDRMRKESAVKIRQSEERYRTLFNTLLEGFCIIEVIFDANGKPTDYRFLETNPAFEQQTGLHEARGKLMRELAPDHDAHWFEIYGRIALTGEPAQFENEAKALNRWYKVSAFRVGGAASHKVAILFDDITARKRAEALLRQNEALFSALVDLAPTGVYVVDAQFRLQQINALALPAFAQVEPKVGRDFGEVMNILWGPELGGEIVKIFRHTLTTGERYVSPRFSNFRQDLGEERAYEWEIQRMALPDSSHGVVCYFNDITERIKTEQTLWQAKATAESASRAKDNFLAALSHELRTPLSPALLLASESADNHQLPEPVRLNFEIIRKNIELEARLIDDLLDLTRITAGKMVLNKVLIDIHDVLMDAVATIQAEQQEKHLRLDIKLSASPSLVEGDAVRLQQIFWNVLKNAVKFTPVNGTITLETSINEQSQLVIKITDTGIGMNADEIARVFTAFAQGDHAGGRDSHRFGGLGLGLAISKNLVELHAGKIVAESTGTGRGSAFIIELPLAKFTKAESKTRNNFPQKDGVEILKVESSSMSVLLVEDHEITRTVLAQLLMRRKYHVVLADSVAKARNIASQEKFDLLISDIGLPDGNGNDLMSEFQKKYGLKGIALTGYGMEEDIARGKAAGFVAHLVKPVRIESLENALNIAKMRTNDHQTS
jgi:PAS domain S-box-containing protein